jgi:DNA-binding LacI/PurR family transcriptional regulator
VRQTISQDGDARGVTIDAVARQARVSPATVSRVLNGDPRVGRAYRDRVHAAVAALGYRPNRLARNLRKQHSAAIGVVVSDIENPHFSEAVRAIEDLAYGRGHPVLVCNTDETPEKERAYLETMMDERVLGVILSPADPREDGVRALIDAGIPVVAFDREASDPRADAVIADNVRGARAATDHLLAAGHREIAFVGGRPEVETGAERLDGYEIAMRAAGCEPRSVAAGFRTELARAGVADLLSGPRRPTGLVIANNLMTLGALEALRDAGARVPGDVALVAIDDPPWASFVAPPLTTVAQPVRRMAADAMELLLDRVNGVRDEPRRIVHSLELRVRESCGTRRS